MSRLRVDTQVSMKGIENGGVRLEVERGSRQLLGDVVETSDPWDVYCIYLDSCVLCKGWGRQKGNRRNAFPA